MSIQSAEKKFRADIMFGNIKKAELFLTENKSALRLFGAAVWSWALTSKQQGKAIALLIKSKAPVHLPKANTKRFTANSDYTLLLAAKYLSLSTIDYLLVSYKIPQRLISEAIIITSNVKTSDSDTQILILQRLISAGGDVTHKNQKALFNATFNDNSAIIPTLIDSGSYLINQACAILYLKAKNKDPLTCIAELRDERNYSALMEVIAADKVNDSPIEHYEE